MVYSTYRNNKNYLINTKIKEHYMGSKDKKKESKGKPKKAKTPVILLI